MAERQASPRGKVTLLAEPQRDRLRDVLHALQHFPDQHDEGLVRHIKEVQSSAAHRVPRELEESVADVLRKARLNELPARDIAGIVHLGRVMAQSQLQLDADWRGKRSLSRVARRTTNVAWNALHPLTRLRVISEALEMTGVPQAERTVSRRVELVQLGVHHLAFLAAAARLAKTLDPLRGRPVIPDGLRFAVKALASFWMRHGPRRVDSRGRRQPPRICESRNHSSFAHFAVAVMTLDQAFEEKRIRWVVRQLAAERRSP